ncbi:putative FtsJ-like methyl transferase [Namao virus]|nr:putative FtsJ-like methyl transferase [Namao virus]
MTERGVTVYQPSYSFFFEYVFMFKKMVYFNKLKLKNIMLSGPPGACEAFLKIKQYEESLEDTEYISTLSPSEYSRLNYLFISQKSENDLITLARSPLPSLIDLVISMGSKEIPDASYYLITFFSEQKQTTDYFKTKLLDFLKSKTFLKTTVACVYIYDNIMMISIIPREYINQSRWETQWIKIPEYDQIDIYLIVASYLAPMDFKNHLKPLVNYNYLYLNMNTTNIDEIHNRMVNIVRATDKMLISHEFLLVPSPLMPVNTEKIDPIPLLPSTTNLNATLNDLESYDMKLYNSVNFNFYPYRNLPKMLSLKHSTIPPTNAFTKLYEMLTYYKLIPQSMDKISTFHICEAPGNFISATIEYCQKYNIGLNWNANTLVEHPDVKTYRAGTILTDQYELMKKHPDRWFFGTDFTGDITNTQNIKDFCTKLKDISFLTGDCGICIDPRRSNHQDIMLAKVNFAQVVILMHILKENGNFVIKHFLPMQDHFFMSYIYLLSVYFKELYFCKPCTSRPTNREIYLIGKGYKKSEVSAELLDMLLDRLENFNLEVPLFKCHLKPAIVQVYHRILSILMSKQLKHLQDLGFFISNSDVYFKNIYVFKKIYRQLCNLWIKNNKLNY